MRLILDKKRAWELLTAAKPGDVQSRRVDIALMALIILNVVEVALSSVHSINARFGPYLYVFEVSSVVVFTIEYVARMWSCTVDRRFSRPITGRIRFFFRPLTLIDLVAVVPFYLPFLGVDLRVIRIFRIFRVLRILKLGRYSKAFQIIQRAIVGKKEELALTGIVLAVLLLVSASLMFFAEREAQPQHFSSIPATLWWSVVTLTTVGYGDVYPITIVGKLIAGLISVLGIGMVALPTGIVSAAFVDEISRTKDEGDHVTGVCPTCGRRCDDDS